MAMNSSNIVVKIVTNIGIYGLHSVMGANKRVLQSKLYMDEMNVYGKVNSESDEVQMSVQIRELCEWRDKCDCTFLTKDECQTIINDLCTNKMCMSLSVFRVSYFIMNKEFQTNKQPTFLIHV